MFSNEHETVSGGAEQEIAAEEPGDFEPARVPGPALGANLWQHARDAMVWAGGLVDALNYLSPLFIALAAVGIAWVAYWQWHVLEKTDRTLNETLIAANRAVIVPHLLKLNAPLKLGQEASLTLLYANSGKEPARHVGHHNGVGFVEIEPTAGTKEITNKIRDAVNALKFEDDCALADQTQYVGVVYPYTTNNSAGVIVDGKLIKQSVLDGLGFIIVKGCFRYDTMGQRHRSTYCLEYSQGLDNVRPPEQRGYFLSCPSGNDAD